jgi:BMFP domain-containing protein YqiC
MSSPRPRRDETAAARRAGHSRRRFLRGAGACLALPALESLRAATATTAAARLATTATGAPLRVAFVYVPNGVIQPTWWPKGTGTETGFELNRTLAPLDRVKKQLQVFSGLDHVNATAGPDGAGDHARASGTFLTGVRVRKTAGANIHAGVSIDQVVAGRVGHLTRFPSLELSCDPVRRSGNCDSGYSCAYQYNLAWRSPTTPVPPESNPRLLFERFFGSGAAGERRASLKHRQERQRSILDFVRDDARDLQRTLAPRDRAKLDEYLASVRAIETRIAAADHLAAATPDPQFDTPLGIPPGYEDHIRLMYDLLALAFQTDSTRVATFLCASEGSNRSFPEIGITEGHHSLTHHQNQKDMIDKVAEIDRFYVRQFARFLEQLAGAKDVDGRSVLDNAMIVYGSGNADGNRHTHTNLPVLLAGGGGGTLRTGRYVTLGAVPMTNLFLALADRLGLTDLDHLGDSTGRLDAV